MLTTYFQAELHRMDRGDPERDLLRRLESNERGRPAIERRRAQWEENEE